MNSYQIYQTENQTFDLIFNGQFIYSYTRKSSAVRRVKQLLAAVKQPENTQNEAVATGIINRPKVNAKAKATEVHTTVASKIKVTAQPIYLIFNIPSQEKGKSAEACAAKRVYAVRRARHRAAAPPLSNRGGAKKTNGKGAEQ